MVLLWACRCSLGHVTEHHSDYDPLITLKCSELTDVVILHSIFLFRIDQKQKYTNKSSQYTLKVSLQGEVCLLAQTSPPYLLFLECIQNSAYLILEYTSFENLSTRR